MTKEFQADTFDAYVGDVAWVVIWDKTKETKQIGIYVKDWSWFNANLKVGSFFVLGIPLQKRAISSLIYLRARVVVVSDNWQRNAHKHKSWKLD